jgi:hypothetical protein
VADSPLKRAKGPLLYTIFTKQSVIPLYS